MERDVAGRERRHPAATGTAGCGARLALSWPGAVPNVAVESCFVVGRWLRLVGDRATGRAVAKLPAAYSLVDRRGGRAGDRSDPLAWMGHLRRTSRGLFAAAGTLLVSQFDAPAGVALGLAVAGHAWRHPVTLAALVATPGLLAPPDCPQSEPQPGYGDPRRPHGPRRTRPVASTCACSTSSPLPLATTRPEPSGPHCPTGVMTPTGNAREHVADAPGVFRVPASASDSVYYWTLWT